MTYEFAHVPLERRKEAVRGFVSLNPHMDGIDFDTMMSILIDSDSFIPLVGDVPITEEVADEIIDIMAWWAHG